MAIKTVVANLKGGSAKTSTALGLAQAGAAEGDRILYIDLDQNNNATDFFLRKASITSIRDKEIMRFFRREIEFSELIWPDVLPGIDMIATTLEIAKLSKEFGGQGTAALKLARPLSNLAYDMIILDTGPSLSLELNMALHVADVVMSPISTDRWQAMGTLDMRREIEQVAESSEKPLPVFVQVPSRVSKKEVETLARLKFNLTKTFIGKHAVIANMKTTGRPMNPDTQAFEQFRELYREIKALGVNHG